MSRLGPLLLLLWSLAALPAAAQEPVLQFRGRGEPRSDARIRELLREGRHQVWTRDTLVTRTDTVRVPVLLVGATARIDGTLLEELIIIAGDVFVRPNARILGPVVNLGGGWYPSALATIAGDLSNDPNAPYEVERGPGGITIRGTTHRRALAFRPEVPTYDRVDGVSLGAGLELLAPPLGRLEPSLRLYGFYRSQRGAFDGGAEAAVARGGTSLRAGAERTTLSNQEWIRGDLTNSLSMLVRGKDYRDYYEADRAWVELHRVAEAGARTTELRLRAQVEDARSLAAGRPWSLFRPDSIRPNGFPDPLRDDPTRRSADQGRISSLIAGAAVEWEHDTFVTGFDAYTEFGIDALDSDFSFGRFELTGEFAMLALRDHTLEIEAHFRGPLPGAGGGDDPSNRIPRQRWSFVGGSGTLYTFGTGEFFGDRLAFVESSYFIPLPRRFRFGLLGIPTLELMHNVGMAWLDGQDRGFEHNIGLRLNYNVLNFRVVTHPDHLADQVELSIGVDFPTRGYPWQPAGGFF